MEQFNDEAEALASLISKQNKRPEPQANAFARMNEQTFSNNGYDDEQEVLEMESAEAPQGESGKGTDRCRGNIFGKVLK